MKPDIRFLHHYILLRYHGIPYISEMNNSTQPMHCTVFPPNNALLLSLLTPQMQRNKLNTSTITKRLN